MCSIADADHWVLRFVSNLQNSSKLDSHDAPVTQFVLRTIPSTVFGYLLYLKSDVDASGYKNFNLSSLRNKNTTGGIPPHHYTFSYILQYVQLCNFKCGIHWFSY